VERFASSYRRENVITGMSQQELGKWRAICNNARKTMLFVH
jgi:hypothetical protein